MARLATLERAARPGGARGRMPARLSRRAARLASGIARRAEPLAHARLRSRRREGLIAGPLLIITGIAALLGVAVVSLLFQKELSATFLFLFTSMPRFEAAVSADGTVAAGNALYGMYLNFRTISFFVMSVAIIVAGLSYGLESINVVPPRAASKILGNGMLYLVVIMVFPHFWDIIADAVEWLSLWILSPEDPSRAHDTVAALLDYMSPGQYPEVDYARLFGGAGSALAEAAFSSIVDFVTMREGDGALRDIGEGYERTVTAFLTEVMLFVLKAIALLTMSLTAFLLGTVRYVLTGLLAVAVPLVLALSLLPQFARVTALMRDTLVALTIVPLFSALAVAAGVAVLSGLDGEDFGSVEVVIGPGDVGREECDAGDEGCEGPETLVPPPSVQELTHGVRKFFMALAVLALAIYFPAMLAPMISRIMSSVQQHVSTTGLASTLLLSGARTAVSHAPAAASAGYRALRGAGWRASDAVQYGRHPPQAHGQLMHGLPASTTDASYTMSEERRRAREAAGREPGVQVRRALPDAPKPEPHNYPTPPGGADDPANTRIQDHVGDAYAHTDRGFDHRSGHLPVLPNLPNGVLPRPRRALPVPDEFPPDDPEPGGGPPAAPTRPPEPPRRVLSAAEMLYSIHRSEEARRLFSYPGARRPARAKRRRSRKARAAAMDGDPDQTRLN